MFYSIETVILILILLTETLIGNEESLKCNYLIKPENGFFIGGYCSNELYAACGLACEPGYRIIGSSFRQCTNNQSNSDGPKWSGSETECRIIKCKELLIGENVKVNCTRDDNEVGTRCYFECQDGYFNLASPVRFCLPIGIWSGTNAKCKKVDPNKFILSTTKPTTTTIQTTTLTHSYFKDLSNWTISFGYSFKKIVLKFTINTLPATSSIWLRTNYTKNIRLLNYNSNCFNVTILTNENSSMLLAIKKEIDLNSTVDYYFDMRKILVRNKWTQFVFVQSVVNDFRIYLDGAVHFDMADFTVVNESTCVIHVDSNIETRNEFKISDDLESTETDLHQPMRGEITRANLYDVERTEDQVLNGFFKCEDSNLVESEAEKASFLWSDVFIDSYLAEFKRKPAKFCSGCEEPELIKHALMYYDGTRNGDVLSYNCQNGYTLVGFSKSVCMIYGDWSHKTPRCKANPSVKMFQKSLLLTTMFKLNSKNSKEDTTSKNGSGLHIDVIGDVN